MLSLAEAGYGGSVLYSEGEEEVLFGGIWVLSFDRVISLSWFTVCDDLTGSHFFNKRGGCPLGYNNNSCCA